MKTAVMNIAAGQCVKFHNEPCLVLEHRQTGTLLMPCNQQQLRKERLGQAPQQHFP